MVPFLRRGPSSLPSTRFFSPFRLVSSCRASLCFRPVPSSLAPSQASFAWRLRGRWVGEVTSRFCACICPRHARTSVLSRSRCICHHSLFLKSSLVLFPEAVQARDWRPRVQPETCHFVYHHQCLAAACCDSVQHNGPNRIVQASKRSNLFARATDAQVRGCDNLRRSYGQSHQQRVPQVAKRGSARAAPLGQATEQTVLRNYCAACSAVEDLRERLWSPLVAVYLHRTFQTNDDQGIGLLNFIGHRNAHRDGDRCQPKCGDMWENHRFETCGSDLGSVTYQHLMANGGRYMGFSSAKENSMRSWLHVA